MLLSPAYTDIFEIMSGAPEQPRYLGRVGDYMSTTDPRWPNVQSPQFLGINQPYQTTQPGSTALAPLGLNDEIYMQGRPSPVPNHHSHEYQYVDNMAASQELGVTSPYQSYIPALIPSPNLGYQAPHLQQSQAMDFYNPGSSRTSNPFQMDQSNTTRQQRQNSTPSTTVSSQRNSPVRILPHPDGLQRLEQGRRGGGQGREAASQSDGAKPRPSGRSRRDPQAEEEDLFVENLRAQNLSWKIVTEMFRERYGKNTSEARLQMRMLRRRKSAAAWQEADNPQSREGYKRRWPDRLRIMSDTMKDSRSKATQTSSTSTTLTPEVALTHNRASRILDKTSTGWRDPHHSSFQSEKRKRRQDDDDNDEHEEKRKRKRRTKTFQITGDPSDPSVMSHRERTRRLEYSCIIGRTSRQPAHHSKLKLSSAQL